MRTRIIVFSGNFEAARKYVAIREYLLIVEIAKKREKREKERKREVKDEERER